MSVHIKNYHSEIPIGNHLGFSKFLKHDIVSGFLVFLIALPLCLGIALASGYPAIAGIFTAIVGSIITTFISNSELTIKGPAAGLIVIVAGCIESFGGDGALGGFTDSDMSAYRMCLAVGVAAAFLQIAFAFKKGGILGEFFPLSAVHGMLAAIGVIIMIKQFPVALGVQGKGEPLEMLKEFPDYIRHLNPEIAFIGLVGVLIMFIWPFIQKKYTFLKSVPAALIVLAVTIPIGMKFNLYTDHTYLFNGHEYNVGQSYLVSMPDHMFGMFDFVTTPDFNAFTGSHLPSALKWTVMFFVIGTLESLLSAKAVDVIDPYKRKTDLNRDILAVGTANVIGSFIGGLPMISEIVRSRANIDNGARTRFADLWHGVFLLLCVALIPTFLHRIPLAALASMLIFTGFRLAHPREFNHVYKIGPEQLLIFLATLIGVLATDLLVGILIGMGIKVIIHFYNGLPVTSLFSVHMNVTPIGEGKVKLTPETSALFTNWISLRSKIVKEGIDRQRNVILDLSNCPLIDHSSMEKLHELQDDFARLQLSLELYGLEVHSPLSDHALSARKRMTKPMQRITIIGPDFLESAISDKLIELGSTGYTSIPCKGRGRTSAQQTFHDVQKLQLQFRIECIVNRQVGNAIIDFVKREVENNYKVTTCIEDVDVVRPDAYLNL